MIDGFVRVILKMDEAYLKWQADELDRQRNVDKKVKPRPR